MATSKRGAAAPIVDLPDARFGVGDIVVRGGTGREHGQLGEVRAVISELGSERYRIAWENGRESIVYPAYATGLHLRHRATS